LFHRFPAYHCLLSLAKFHQYTSVSIEFNVQHERQELHPEGDVDGIRTVDRQIRHAGELMNYLFYELYGLTEEEILMVAGLLQATQGLEQILPVSWQLVGDSSGRQSILWITMQLELLTTGDLIASLVFCNI